MRVRRFHAANKACLELRFGIMDDIAIIDIW
jgi:hypothetical protein